MKRAFWILAAACAVLGGLCAAVPGLRFGALLLLCAAAFCAALALLSRLAETRRWARICRTALLALFCAGFALFAVLEAMVISGADGDADDTPVSCVVILGAGVNGTQPSLMLWSRLNAALEYLADKPDVPVIVSGCRGRGEEISEAECMYRWLTAHGIEADRVWKEEQATSTRTNFARSYELMAARGVSGDFAFVTNDYHVCRAGRIADTPLAHGVAARLPRSAYYDVLTLNYYVREAFALANELFFRMDLDL